MEIGGFGGRGGEIGLHLPLFDPDQAFNICRLHLFWNILMAAFVSHEGRPLRLGPPKHPVFLFGIELLAHLPPSLSERHCILSHRLDRLSLERLAAVSQIR